MATTLDILHFNDVYNIQGAPAFLASILASTASLAALSRPRPALLFSGDAFSPSLHATVFLGSHMPPVLNALKPAAACLGNHDLDFGDQRAAELIAECEFPWLCSNARSAKSGTPLASTADHVVLENFAGAEGVTALVIGVVEHDWMATLATIDPEDVDFEDPVEWVRRRVPELKAESGADLVVALSHMRMPNDIRLADECGGPDGLIDIVLGGHDHHYEDKPRPNGTSVYNSGTDFRDHSVVTMHRPAPGARFKVLETRRVTAEPRVAALQAVVAEFSSGVAANMSKPLGRVGVPLDARFAAIRTRETNVSNLMADLLRGSVADCALFNSGTLRADRVIPNGVFTMGDLTELLPMYDETVAVKVTGEQLLECLENGVCKYPAMEGRFPCVSGIKFKFDPTKPPMSRVVPGSVYVAKKSNGPPRLDEYRPMELTETYSLMTKEYLAKGKDGYTSLASADELFDGPLLPVALKNIFTLQTVVRRWCDLRREAAPPALENKAGDAVSAEVGAKIKLFLKTRVRGEEVAESKKEESWVTLAPEVDGRIVNIGEEIPVEAVA